MNFDLDYLVKYGLIPEFIGRIPVCAVLDRLTKETLESILTEPRDALVKQFKTLLSMDNVELKFEQESVEAIANEAFKRKTDFCWHCHTGIYSYPMWVAIEKKIPLIFWGEPSADYTSYYSYEDEELVDSKRFNRFINLGINADDMFLKLQGQVDLRDLKPYTYPPESKLKEINCLSVCLGGWVIAFYVCFMYFVMRGVSYSYQSVPFRTHANPLVARLHFQAKLLPPTCPSTLKQSISY